MNLWGFGESFVKEADRRFARWLDENLGKRTRSKCEYFLPLVVSELIGERKPPSRCCAAPISGMASPTARINPWWWKPSPRRPTALENLRNVIKNTTGQRPSRIYNTGCRIR